MIRKKFSKQNRVTKINKTEVKLSNGVTFTIMHDLKMTGSAHSFNAAFDSWLARTEDYTADSFCTHVKSKKPDAIFCTLDDYNKIVAGNSTDATKEEYEAENN